MIAVVVKAFGEVKQGDIVDTSSWRNAEQQLRVRQIRPASASELALYERGTRTIHQPAKDPGRAAPKKVAAAV